ncbi:hypothetical protein OIU76_015496 [Salix suchowensis]|nr:hypothetical protein OIU76_015496 [Salix suchowensis]
MGIHLYNTKQIAQRILQSPQVCQKGHFAVYVGETQTRFVVPISYLKNPSFQNLLSRVEEEQALIIQWEVSPSSALCKSSSISLATCRSSRDSSNLE